MPPENAIAPSFACLHRNAAGTATLRHCCQVRNPVCQEQQTLSLKTLVMTLCTLSSIWNVVAGYLRRTFPYLLHSSKCSTVFTTRSFRYIYMFHLIASKSSAHSQKFDNKITIENVQAGNTTVSSVYTRSTSASVASDYGRDDPMSGRGEQRRRSM